MVTTLHMFVIPPRFLIFVDGIESIDLKTVEADITWSIKWPNVPSLSDFPSPHLPFPGGGSLPPPISLPILPAPPSSTSLPSDEGELGPEGIDHRIDGPAPITPLAASAGISSTPPSAVPLALTVMGETKSPTLTSTSDPEPIQPVIPSSSIVSVPSSSKPAPAHAAAPFGITSQRSTFYSADDSTDSCTICSSPFGTLRRRHHCRHCGMSIIPYQQSVVHHFISHGTQLIDPNE
jgi:hypothetical protein